jgi:hypothetical protein
LKGVAYEVWIDFAYVFIRDVCHFVNEGIEESRE